MEGIPDRAIVRLRTAALDEIPLGIVRLGKDRRITYLNQVASEITAKLFFVGADLLELPMDAASRETLRTQLDRRFSAQHGSCYTIQLLAPKPRGPIIVEISAFPEYAGNGTLIGSIGFLRNLSAQRAAVGMHSAIANASDWRDLLTRVAAELHKHIDFDSMSVTVLSKGGNHLRRLIQTDGGEEPPLPMKWWPMPAVVKELLKTFVIDSLCVAEMFSRSPYKELAKTDAVAKEWLKLGIKHLLRYPVFQRGKMAAIVNLQRTADVPFSLAEQDIFRELPIEEAVNIALTLDEKTEAGFYLDVIRDLGSVADNSNELQARLVARLYDYYKWEHIGLFNVDFSNEVFRLVRQNHAAGHDGVPEGYEQPFDKGVLGEVLRTQRAVIVADVTTLERGTAYIDGIKSTRSEMCLPVPGPRLRWILNVESNLKDSFVDEERQSVELLLEVVGFMLDRAATIELKAAIFEAVADGVVLTSREGLIQDVNPAGARLLGLPLDQMRDRCIADFLEPPADSVDSRIDDRNFAQSLVSHSTLLSTPVAIRSANGSRIPAVASGAPLANNLGGKVFVLSDLTYLTRLRQMEHLKSIFSAVAAETRVPLSLASTFLGDIANGTGDVHELASKALAQLRKADLPLERLVRLSTRPPDHPLPVTVFDIGDTIARLVAELPRHQANAVHVMKSTTETLAKGGFAEFAFCFQSILAYLLRRKAQVDDLEVDIETEGNSAVVAIYLQRHGQDARERSSVALAEGVLREFSFPQDVIADLIGRMGGQYHAPGPGDPRFVLNLPSA
jgi:PAS domain S-box-containing protein